MKYCIQRKLFSIKPSFRIKDENGKDAFLVKTNFRPFGKKFLILDADQKELCHIYRKFSFVDTEYNIGLVDDPEDVVTITRKFNVVKSEYSLEGTKGLYSINGDIFDESFYIEKDMQKTAKVLLNIPAVSASYTVLVPKGNIAIKVLAIMIVICLTRRKYLI